MNLSYFRERNPVKSLENLLRKQVKLRTEQVNGLLDALQDSQAQIEMLQSLGCAFVWDIELLGKEEAVKIWRSILLESTK